MKSLDPPSEPLEKTKITIGYIPLTDCAPLIIALEHGWFAKMGLDVELKPQGGWATLRDRVLAGELDAAQMLAPLVIASNARLSHDAYRLVTGLILSRNGNAITLAESCVRELESLTGNTIEVPFVGEKLIPLLESRDRPLVFASVHPHSAHELLLRHWLRNIPNRLKHRWRIVVIPPVQMVAAMKEGQIDGYCVGGPWNADAVRRGLGVTVATSVDLLANHPEKVLGVRAEWSAAYKNTHIALIRALCEAGAWLDSVANRFEAARLMWDKGYVKAPLDVIAPSLLDSCLIRSGQSPRSVVGYHRFYGPDCNFPSVVDGMNIGQQLYACGLLNQAPTAKEIESTFLESLFNEALAQ